VDSDDVPQSEPPSQQQQYDRAYRRGRGSSVHRSARRFRHGPPAAPLRRPQAAACGRRGRRLAPGTGQRARRRRAAALRPEAQIVHRGGHRVASAAVRRAVVGNRDPPAAQELCRLWIHVVGRYRKGEININIVTELAKKKKKPKFSVLYYTFLHYPICNFLNIFSRLSGADSLYGCILYA